MNEKTPNLNFAQCKEKCIKTHVYFGRQSKNDCYCGNDPGKYGEDIRCRCTATDDVGGNVNCVYQSNKHKVDSYKCYLNIDR